MSSIYTQRDQLESHPGCIPSISASTPVSEPLPSLPIMPATRLQLELLLKDSVTDLKRVTEVILADPGATLQILRLIGEEYPEESERPRRIEDCIVTLSPGRCYQTICASQSPHSGPHVAEWQHCRRVAECARELARNLDGFSPDEAYLVGLLSRLGRFPQLLGWKAGTVLSNEATALGVMLAYHWNLPQCVLSAIAEQQEMQTPPKWSDFLTLADQLAEQCAA